MFQCYASHIHLLLFYYVKSDIELKTTCLLPDTVMWQKSNTFQCFVYYHLDNINEGNQSKT